MESNNRSRLSSFLGNRRTLILLSLILAVITWLTISINDSPVIERTIKDVKVQVDESLPNQLGYKAFGADDLYVDVTVSGRRYEVGDNVLSAKDINVVAVTSYVDAPGKYTLQLRATPKDGNADYSIIAKSSDYVEVYFDAPKTVDVELTPQVHAKAPILASDDYFTEDPILSPKTLTVYGPATEVEKIDKAYASVTTDGHLKRSETSDAVLKIVDVNGQEIHYLQNQNATTVTVTIPVYKRATLPTTVGFANVPSGYVKEAPSFSVYPTTVKVGVDAVKLRDMDNISVGTIDFQRLHAGTNTFTFKGSDITDGRAIDPDQEFTVTVQMGELATKEMNFDLGTIRFRNAPANFQLTPEKGALVLTLVGPKSELDALSAEDLTATANLGGVAIHRGTNTIPLTIRVGKDHCWSYGDHTALVTATRN